jgi:hypothetical protein
MKGWRAIGWLALASLVVQIPFLRRGISPLDEGSILAIAHDLARGERLYADVVTPFPPLTYEAIALLVKWLGPHLLIPRLFIALLFSACVLLVFDLLRQLVPPGWAWAGAIGMIALKPLAFPLWTIVNYSQLAMLFSLLALFAFFRFLPERRLGWLAASGVAVGAALATKQNLGLLIGGVCLMGIVGDWSRDCAGTRARPARACAVLLGGLLIPVVFFLGVQTAQGSLGSFVEHALLGLVTLVDAYHIPLPPLRLWCWRGEGLGALAFSYYPAPLVLLLLQGQLSLGWPPLVAVVGVFVEATYYVPLLSLLPAGFWLIRGARGAESRLPWTRWLIVSSFAGGCYASMLYRADWAHLMNVYPAQLLLVTAVAARSVVRFPRLWYPALGLFLIWAGAAVAVAVATLIGTGSTVDTMLGRLQGAPDRALSTHRILDHLASRPSDERIAMLPDIPLYYPLSARPNPLAYDLLLPGIIRAEDDRRASAELASVERVIYNPKAAPSVWRLLPEFAPRTAAALAHDFEVEEVLSEAAYVLTRREGRRGSSRLAADLWELFDPRRIEVVSRRQRRDLSDPGRVIEQTHWLMYRVISTPLDARIVSACFSIPYAVNRGEKLAVTPLFDPRVWPPDYSKTWYPETSPALFQVSVETGSGKAVTLWSRELLPGPPEPSLRLSLDPFAGQPVALRFCTRPVGRAPAGEIRAPVGWAEPRILGSFEGGEAGDSEPAAVRTPPETGTHPHPDRAG